MTQPAALTNRDDIAAILAGRHGDPFSVLGVHDGIVRAFVPGAEEVSVETPDGKPLGKLTCRDSQGFFDGEAAKIGPVRLRARGHGAEWSYLDPYSFGPVLGELDDYLIGEGSHLRLFDKMGAHVTTHQGVEGVSFAVWAPNAQRVSVVGEFNHWDGRRHAMRKRLGNGIWEIFIPGVPDGTAYKYEIVANDGRLMPLKADPFAFASEMRPKTASRVHRKGGHEWQDQGHMEHWAGVDKRRVPVSIYEVHAGSWQRADDGGFLTWDEMADRLIPYAVDMGFTHIEFLPVSEHPYDPSWGYQTTGLYAPSARFGDVDGMARFVEGAHAAGLGVILDWVPAHFPTDAHGLGQFDGTHLYEHADPKEGYHPDWNTLIYNFGRREVENYLVNNALFWAERYHVDGLRVDAVASMLYRDYSRKEGEWIPNDEGGRENKEAIAFLRRMNTEVYAHHPHMMNIAEESTAFPGVSAPVDQGGLGFGFKWNMGFMHDTLSYLQKEPIYRKHHHGEITFGLVYAFSENFVLPISHDEVVHGKGSMLTKMSGADDWQKFATLRAYYGFMWGYPGKKLLFMGQEFAQRGEWAEARALDWWHLDDPMHKGVQSTVRDLNRVYRDYPALHGRDNESDGFVWCVADDAENSVFAWVRRAPGGEPVLVVTNFTPVPREGYDIPLPDDLTGTWSEIVNTDAADYGGSGMGNAGKVEAKGNRLTLTLPPLSTLILAHDPG
ncbi:1,4-alpha-glucan branching enzyme [Rubricella aquisinus]|uniref:1,4-alpha-glucan branching enzyme GlgB n=1 Tax=Rubricella aquisinus TaxID=2028108 RepID=A0A840X7X8_9RHOB|nr:1,4-alpha-glucan branching protein GlgB [Rubricella aquisinus]MBB5516817.1 1,4-alpha-glucan branching enzyme [Rubricella aquisinus]